MKQKKFGLFSLLLLLMVSSGAILTLSSKKEPDLWAPPSPCVDPSNYLNGKIQIILSPDSNPFRNTGYEYYIPNPDIRIANDSPAGYESEYSKYYCIVTITSPDCSEFHWQQALDLNNSGGTNTMNIKRPPAQHAMTLKVEYYERAESFATPDFNQTAPNGLPESRIKFQYQYTFMGWPNSNVAQPIYLNPAQNIGVINLEGRPINVGAPKNYDFGDGTMNSWIDITG